MRTILVTGGAGFIGSNVAKRLTGSNNRIVIFDNLSTGQKSAIPKGAIFVKGDVRSRETVASTLNKYKPDVVLHIAGQASNITSFADPYADADVNYKGTINVVRACVAHRVSRLVYASSMLATGPSGGPTSYYGISKYAAERFVMATAIRPDLGSKLSVTALRMFNVYGPGQSITNPYQGVLAIFIGDVLRGEPIKIYGTGRQTRDFIYIDDVCDAWKRVIDNKKSYGKVLDLGSGKPISVSNLAVAVVKACGQNSKTYPVKHLPKRPGDEPVVKAQMRETRKLLNFVPKISFADGFRRTIAWAQRT